MDIIEKPQTDFMYVVQIEITTELFRISETFYVKSHTDLELLKVKEITYGYKILSQKVVHSQTCEEILNRIVKIKNNPFS